MTTPHNCPATGCTRRVGTRQLMCRPHWFMVPKPLRDAVWDAWRGGLGAGSPAHTDAITAAAAAVNEKLAGKAATAAGGGKLMTDQIRGPSRSATAEIIARFANAGRDDPAIADRIGITVAQVRGLREEFRIPPGETRWSHGHQRPGEDTEAAAAAAELEDSE